MFVNFDCFRTVSYIRGKETELFLAFRVPGPRLGCFSPVLPDSPTAGSEGEVFFFFFSPCGSQILVHMVSIAHSRVRL